MCGRIVTKYSSAELLGVIPTLRGPVTGCDSPSFGSYNAAPTQQVPIIQRTESGDLEFNPSATWSFLQPGAIPREPTAKGPALPFIARCETASTSDLFKQAFASGRAIVPASGFFEWQVQPDATKRAMYITRADGAPLLLAAITGQAHSFAILTTEASRDAAAIHNRTPVVIEPACVSAWLNPQSPAATLKALCRPLPVGLLKWHGVAARVGDARNDDAALVERV